MRLDPQALVCLPREVCRQHNAVPFARVGHHLMVALLDPEALRVLARLAASLTLCPVVVPPSILERMLAEWTARQTYATESFRTSLPDWVEVTAFGRFASAVPELARETPIVRVVNLILSQALIDKASEVLILPAAHGTKVYFRIDGQALEVMSPPSHIHDAVLTRLRQLAGLSPRGRAGWFQHPHGQENRNIHASFLFTAHGEGCRLEPAATAPLDLPAGFLEALQRPAGRILVEAPEGHGLRRTFGSVLHHLARRFPWALASWSCAWADQPVVWAASGQHDLLRELRDVEAPVVIERLTDGGDELASLSERTLVVAGTRRADPQGALGVLRQRLVRLACPLCHAKGCDECKMTGGRGTRLVSHWSGDETPTLSAQIWELVERGEVHPHEATLAIGPPGFGP